jgi:hypothetical protein
MAVNTVIPFPVSSQVIPSPAIQIVENVITQNQLERVIQLRNAADAFAKYLEKADSGVKAALESVATVEPGTHVASLKEQFKRSIAWKDVAIRLAERLYGDGRGNAYAENVLQNTKPDRSVKLVVS